MENQLIESAQLNKPRKEWIDCLRGLAMIFVVLVHASIGLNHRDWYNVFIGPIMLPLFFAISGYLFSVKNISAIKFYKKLTLTILFTSRFHSISMDCINERQNALLYSSSKLL